jgi:hypothetical protein
LGRTLRITSLAATDSGQVRASIDQGQVVHYQVTPVYQGPRTVPVAYEMTAHGTLNGRLALALQDEPAIDRVWGNRHRIMIRRTREAPCMKRYDN